MSEVNLPSYVGSYAVERELGAGGMGTVYLARSRGGRTVAVKVARPELAADPHFRERFRAEVEAARKVGGFHTAQVVDADPEAAAPWLATAYIAGPTLSGLLAAQGPMGEADLRLLGAALAEALQAIHGCGLVHRDLKPGNIIMADDGPRVLDFGIARALESSRLTSTGAAFGTPGFLAPEQAQGLEVDAAADVFALGAVLVAAAGGSAFGGGTPMGLMYRAVHEEPDLSALPPRIRPTIATCLAKNPAQRPTPQALLDHFAPSIAPQPTAVVHSLTLPNAAVPPTPPPGAATSPVDGGVAGALTVAAAPHARPGPPAPTAPEPERQRPGLRIAKIAAVVIAVGGAGYGAYELSDASFPEATHELTAPVSLLGGVYEHDGTSPLTPNDQPNTLTERNVKHFSVQYKGTAKAPTFETVHLYGSTGLFKSASPDSLIDAMTVTGSEVVQAGLSTIRVPGSDVDIRCVTVDGSTVCGWGDANTEVAIEFTPSAPLDLAAAETSKIRDDIRKPIRQGTGKP
ncbi:serine/threonine protein kinase [Streptomyces sp. NBC_00237]|uniref:serine/threonine-protein kinase n=1 Tax=Streptomyces sp. NBC_00237 TaxID=2975687 RepID=UPI0022568303|nr:serine/threonine-protein kinase [Streptomyces sp. NBC_00237]MCX5204134.1 serine/threonine protein kinase [Streptomyces sp. NBC_00237]